MAKFSKYNNPKKRRRSYGCGYGSGFYDLSRDQYIDSLARLSMEKEKRAETKKDKSESEDS